jgi:uncharacterized membrane protein
MRRRGLRIGLVLLLVAVTRFAMNQYVVQEGLVALVAIAVVLVLVLFALVAFVLLQEGVRWAMRGLNANLARLTVWNRLHVRASRLRARL